MKVSESYGGLFVFEWLVAFFTRYFLLQPVYNSLIKGQIFFNAIVLVLSLNGLSSSKGGR